MDYKENYILTINFVSATLVLVLCIFTLNSLEIDGKLSSNITNEISDNKIDDDFKDYLIKYYVRGGLTGKYDSIFYNSTNNHLLRNNQRYDIVLPDITLSNSLYDTQLTEKEQKNLSKLITDGNFFNISFNNDKPKCCDITYYKLEVISGGKINSVTWTSENILDSSQYGELPLVVTQIVNTLYEFTANSTLLFSESELKNK